MPMIRMPAPIPTIRTKFGCFPLLEATNDVGVEGRCVYACAGDVATWGAVYK